MRASLVWKLGFVAMRALGKRAGDQMIVRPPPVAPRFGMSSLGICHGSVLSSLYVLQPGTGGRAAFPNLIP